VQWQTSVPDQLSRTGWGGRTADLLRSHNSESQISLAISIAGTNTFEVGNSVIPYQVSPDGALAFQGMTGSNNANVRFQAFKDLLALPQNNILAQTYADTVKRSIAQNDLLTTALAGTAPLTTVFPANSLGRQLNMVAKMIAARNSLNMRRQIFFCSVQGYDTHGDQLTAHANLLTELSQGLNAFYNATSEMGVANDVATFTASDFGRTFPDERQRLRSRMGQPPARHGRRGARRPALRLFPDARRQWSGRYRPRPLDSDDLCRRILSHPRALVRRQRIGSADRASEHRSLRAAESRLHQLACREALSFRRF
jgi:hypothetical protein